MTRPTAKADECAHVREMLELLNHDLRGEIVQQETPDFRLMLTDGRRIGLEHTRAVNEAIARGRGAKSRLESMGQQGLEKAGLLAHVNVSLSEGAAAALNAEPAVLRTEVAAIVELARAALLLPEEEGAGGWRRFVQFEDDMVADDGTVVWRDPDRQRGPRDLEDYGIRCTAVMVRPYKSALVTCSGSGFAQGPAIVQAAIDDKAEHLASYRASGDDEQWLLIVGSTGAGSALDTEHVRGEFVSPFDRTIFLELFARHCIDLRTRPPIT